MEILFEDYYLLAINKPAGLSSESGKDSHPSAEKEALAFFTGKLQKNAPSGRLQQAPYLRAVHRLDRSTSGVLLFAKSKQALTRLMQQFEQRSIEKIYLAVVEKQPPAPSGRLEHWLLKDESGRKALVFDQKTLSAQQCVLDYAIISNAQGSFMLEVHPKTGRFHQIRAQLAHIGCPIIGDVLYGGSIWRENQIKLHARQLIFNHPKTGARMMIEGPLPDGF